MKGPKWSGASPEALDAIPGPHFTTHITTDAGASGLIHNPSDGQSDELLLHVRLHAGTEESGAMRRTVVVVFIGGVTFAEIAALRFLGSQQHVNCDFVVATTKLINGTSLLQTFTV